jgi:hypothetical protein
MSLAAEIAADGADGGADGSREKSAGINEPRVSIKGFRQFLDSSRLDSSREQIGAGKKHGYKKAALPKGVVEHHGWTFDGSKSDHIVGVLKSGEELIVYNTALNKKPDDHHVIDGFTFDAVLRKMMGDKEAPQCPSPDEAFEHYRKNRKAGLKSELKLGSGSRHMNQGNLHERMGMMHLGGRRGYSDHEYDDDDNEYEDE